MLQTKKTAATRAHRRMENMSKKTNVYSSILCIYIATMQLWIIILVKTLLPRIFKSNSMYIVHRYKLAGPSNTVYQNTYCCCLKYIWILQQLLAISCHPVPITSFDFASTKRSLLPAINVVPILLSLYLPKHSQLSVELANTFFHNRPLSPNKFADIFIRLKWRWNIC